MQDSFGRRIEYLRISVTDKCNLRCVYCMPEAGLPWLKHEQILSYEEIAAIVHTMAGMGLRRVRLTGGEPLVRRNLPHLVRLLKAIDGIDDIAVTTAVLPAGGEHVYAVEVTADVASDVTSDQADCAVGSRLPSSRHFP